MQNTAWRMICAGAPLRFPCRPDICLVDVHSRGLPSMEVFRSTAIAAAAARYPISAKRLRQWCAPQVVLAVTNLTDEAAIMPHLISQARYSTSKILLAHVVKTSDRTSHCRRPSVARPSIQEARATLDRMARHLRWLGFTCEPLVLSGSPELEILSLARSCCVDRVILGFQENPDPTRVSSPSEAELLLPLMEVPTCMIGRLTSPSKGIFVKNITLAISDDLDCEVPLAFASRFAQELRAKLTLLHVFNPERNQRVCTAQALASSLPSPTWREAELLCATEIDVREGEPAEEIVKHCRSTNQDLLILCSPGKPAPGHRWDDSVGYRAIAGSQGPVFVLRKHGGLIELAASDDMVPEKIPAYGEGPLAPAGKQGVSKASPSR